MNPEQARELDIARKVTALEETEGWREFVTLAHQLMNTYAPQASDFTPEDATKIASKVVFINGIKRCLGIMAHQKDVLKSLKKDSV